MQFIPTIQYADSDIAVALNGITYRFITAWEERQQSWYLYILNQDRSPVINKIKLFYPGNILEQYSIPQFQQSLLYLVKNEDNNDPIRFENVGLGKDYTLVFTTDEEEEILVTNLLALISP